MDTARDRVSCGRRIPDAGRTVRRSTQVLLSAKAMWWVEALVIFNMHVRLTPTCGALNILRNMRALMHKIKQRNGKERCEIKRTERKTHQLTLRLEDDVVEVDRHLGFPTCSDETVARIVPHWLLV